MIFELFCIPFCCVITSSCVTDVLRISVGCYGQVDHRNKVNNLNNLYLSLLVESKPWLALLCIWQMAALVVGTICEVIVTHWHLAT